MSKKVEDLTVKILRDIRDELHSLNGRVGELNGRVDQLTIETRDGFLQLRREWHADIVGHRRSVDARFALMERRLHRVENKK